MKDFSVPFTLRKEWKGDPEPGSLSLGCYHADDNTDWLPNSEFECTFLIGELNNSGYSKQLRLLTEDGRSAQMFLRDVVKMLQVATISGGKVSGRWTYSKRGDRFGVRYVPKEEGK